MTMTREQVAALLDGAGRNLGTDLEKARAEAYEKGMDDAADQILAWLAKAVGAEQYSPCDGSETWDGDVHGTIYAILKAGGVYDDEDGRVAKLADADMARAALVERAAEARGMERAAEEVTAQADMLSCAGVDPGQIGALWNAAVAIRTLAPDAGVQELARINAERVRKDQAIEAWSDDLIKRLGERLVMSQFLSRDELYQEQESQRLEAADTIARLREALRDISKTSGNSGALAAHKCGEIARAALKAGGE